jgi:hypothetical protein
MGQEYLPGRIGVSAGVTIGLSIGLGGIGAPLLGLLADADGLRAVFEVVAALPLGGLLLALALPSGAPRATSVPARPATPSGAAPLTPSGEAPVPPRSAAGAGDRRVAP